MKDSKEIICQDLDELALLLNQTLVGFCNDTKPLYDAVANCNHYSSDDSWEYNVSNLTFSVPNQNHCIPKQADLIQLSLSLSIRGSYFQEVAYHPVSDLTFNIELYGYNDQAENIHAAWHLDKHIYTSGDGTPEYFHPEFHFAYGGDKMLSSGLDYGSSLVMPSPRLLHPPMDAVLGIDWVLRNYIPYDSISALVEGREYRKLLARSQNRIWRPYFLCIATNWSSNFFSDHTIISPLSLLPNLITPMS